MKIVLPATGKLPWTAQRKKNGNGRGEQKGI